jgi:uncharacterized protein
MESPCIKICVLDPDLGQCTGCGRTAAEIAAWTALSPGERRSIMSQLDVRPGPHQRAGRRPQEA